MKKTLMVLSFALCASFAFAQSKSIVIDKSPVDMNVAALNAKANLAKASANYKGSIFTKDDDEYFSCTFSAAEQTAGKFTTGIVGANEMVDGTNIAQHTNLGDYGRWARIPSLSYYSTNDYSETYPALSYAFGMLIANNFDSPTVDDGFMMMSMIDNYGTWGGDNDPGNFDAWIRFQTIDLSDCSLARLSFYQLYRAFNVDKCFVDYSLNGGTTWSTYEFNVRGVEVNSNNYAFGMKRITLPASIAGQSNVTLRIRWTENTGNGGYFWVLDDVTITLVPENHLAYTSNQYFEGFYQMMPKGLQLPVVWASDFKNDGRNAQLNATGKIYTMVEGESATLLAQTDPTRTIVAKADSNRAFVIDPQGYYDSASSFHGWNSYFDSAWKTGPYVCLPTGEENLGANYFFTDATTSFYNLHVYDTLGTFDTLIYDVNWGTITDNVGQVHPAGIWARDHGVVTFNGDGTNGVGNYYTPGSVDAGVWSDDYRETTWNHSGYGNFVRYQTGRTLPNDWRILGIEMVASTTTGMEGVGARIWPVLYRDSAPDASHLNFIYVETGHEDAYTIQQGDVNIMTGGYRTIGQGYNTIRILFPDQPRLDTSEIYYLGYILAEDADFAVSEARTNYRQNDSVYYFRDESGMEGYRHVLTKNRGNGNIYSVWTRDMFGDEADMSYYNTDVFPMIRMIVGPSYHVTKFRVSWECENENEGGFYSTNMDPLCGAFDSVAEGYGTQFLIYPEMGYEIESVTINGVETDQYTLATDADGRQYGVLTIESVTEEMAFSCSFREAQGGVSIDPVASRVAMKLQPNPATSNVFVSLKGVTGNVNMSLLDMSGRVVTTSQFNAETGANINVSNLAKGAYFVRITNNNFTKIEKLIVR